MGVRCRKNKMLIFELKITGIVTVKIFLEMRLFDHLDSGPKGLENITKEKRIWKVDSFFVVFAKILLKDMLFLLCSDFKVIYSPSDGCSFYSWRMHTFSLSGLLSHPIF